MATRVAEARLQLSRSQARVERVRSRALPVLFRCVGDGGSILLHALEKSRCPGEFVSFEEISDGRREVEDREFLFRECLRQVFAGGGH